MKLARYVKEGQIHYGSLVSEDTLERISGVPFESITLTGKRDLVSDVKLLAPVAPKSVYGVGMNYVSHIKEMKALTPKIPLLFMKPSSTVIGPDEAIVFPLEGDVVHYEAELAVVIGKQARRVSPGDALRYVLGYTAANDVSERVIQKEEMGMGSLLVCKAFDTFCPLGPYIETELDPSNLRLRGSLNGSVKQDGNTADLLFDVPCLISYLSQSITLNPGDIILTGTPVGVGVLTPGDIFEIEIDGIGKLRNPVVAERREDH